MAFDKFITAKRTLTTQMKATGEVMSICQNFEGALMKAIRSLEQNIYSLDYGKYHELTDEELKEHLYRIDDRRLSVSQRLFVVVIHWKKSMPSIRSISGSWIRLPTLSRWNSV